MALVIAQVVTLTHCGLITPYGVIDLVSIGSANALSTVRRQVIPSTNADLLPVWSLGTSVSEILIETEMLSMKKIHLNCRLRMDDNVIERLRDDVV